MKEQKNEAEPSWHLPLWPAPGEERLTRKLQLRAPSFPRWFEVTATELAKLEMAR